MHVHQEIGRHDADRQSRRRPRGLLAPPSWAMKIPHCGRRQAPGVASGLNVSISLLAVRPEKLWRLPVVERSRCKQRIECRLPRRVGLHADHVGDRFAEPPKRRQDALRVLRIAGIAKGRRSGSPCRAISAGRKGNGGALRITTQIVSSSGARPQRCRDTLRSSPALRKRMNDQARLESSDRPDAA